jgi:hypothetical protein
MRGCQVESFRQFRKALRPFRRNLWGKQDINWRLNWQQCRKNYTTLTSEICDVIDGDEKWVRNLDFHLLQLSSRLEPSKVTCKRSVAVSSQEPISKFKVKFKVRPSSHYQIWHTILRYLGKKIFWNIDNLNTGFLG